MTAARLASTLVNLSRVVEWLTAWLSDGLPG